MTSLQPLAAPSNPAVYVRVVDDSSSAAAKMASNSLSAPAPFTFASSSSTSQAQVLTNDWKSGLFQCLGDSIVPNAAMAFCCPWITLAQVSTRLGLVRYVNGLLYFGALTLLTLMAFCGVWCSSMASSKDRHDHDHDHDSSNLGFMAGLQLFAWMILYIALVVSVALLRSRVRQRYAIAGDDMEDYAVACACHCCAAAQMATQVESYQPGTCAFGAPQVLPAYQN